MNLLENYLVKIIKIEPFTDEDWSNEEWAKDKEFIWVTAVFNCYGCETTNRRVYDTKEWEAIVEKGYYMG